MLVCSVCFYTTLYLNETEVVDDATKSEDCEDEIAQCTQDCMLIDQPADRIQIPAAKIPYFITFAPHI